MRILGLRNRLVLFGLAFAWPAVLSAAFTITGATVNGGASATVETGEAVTIGLTVTGPTAGDMWRATQWLFATADGTKACGNHANRNSNGTETFSATAPTDPGTYNLYLVARGTDACAGTASPLFTLANALTVNYSFSITGATVDGAASTSVAPSASITVAVNVTGASNSGGEWKGTEWRIAAADGARTCANTQNKNSSPASDSFSVTAPAGVGVYNLYLVARGEDACTGGKSALFTLAGAVTVSGGSVCGNATLEGGEQCDDGNTANGDCCSSTCQFESAATVCRASAGLCDEAETCTGASGACPADAFLAASTVCRPAAGSCDLAESCTGSAAACPPDLFAAEFTTCGSSDSTACDAADSCDAVGNCVDRVDPAASICLAGTGTCDPDDTCDGTSKSCSAQVAPEFTACGSSDSTACDAADSCDATGSCVDRVDPAATVCLAGTGTCDPDDTCDGTAKSCAAAYEAEFFPCGDPDSTECNAADSCDGSGSCVARVDPEFTECGAAGDGVCDLQDSCDDAGGCVDRVEPTTTTCDDGNECTSTSTLPGEDDFCDGAGACDVQFVVTGGSCGDGTDTSCTLADTCDGAGTCLFNNQPCGALTDGGHCEFDVEPDQGTCAGGDADGEACSLATAGACEAGGGVCESSSQMRLAFSPDVQNWVAYKLNASNPGQVFYNAIYDASAATDGVTLSFEIPYPFVTQGATPLQVYDADAVPSDGNGCLVPDTALQSIGRTIALADWIDGTSAADLVCDQVDEWGESGVCTLTATVPQAVIDGTANGLLYLNLHLDYGLKGPHVDADSDTYADRYDRAGAISPWGSSDALVETDTNDGPVAIADCTSYAFSHGDEGGTQFAALVENQNLFKKIAGAFGRVACADTGDAIGGTMKLFRLSTTGSTLVFGPSTIDPDGFYALAFQHKGRAASFAIEWCAAGDCHTTEPFWLQSNGWSEVNLTAEDGCDDLDGTTAASDWKPIAPLYGSGKFKNQ